MNAPLPLNVVPHEDEPLLRSQLCAVPANGYLYQEGEKSTELYRIRSGIVCLESVNERGERCIFHLVGSGSVVGHEAVHRLPRSFDVRACTDVFLEAILLPSSTGSALSNSMMGWVHATQAKLLQDAAKFKVDLHRARASEKVRLLLKQIKKLHPDQANAYWLPSRSEMADILEINHVTASRVVARLFRDGTLQRAGNKEFVQIDWGLLSGRGCVE